MQACIVRDCPANHLDHAVAAVVWVCDALAGVLVEILIHALLQDGVCRNKRQDHYTQTNCFICRWPFWVGFGVTGGLILKLSLSLTGAQDVQLATVASCCVMRPWSLSHACWSASAHVYQLHCYCLIADEDIKNSSERAASAEFS